MSKVPTKEISTISGNQGGSPLKSRLVLSRTLVLVLNPLSEACSSTVHRLSSKKVERVFEDFKKCNQHGISVLLRDAIDDINLVGWISPFTLLIHGSSEDMDTIHQAWVGRMLKPPKDFVIKEFGEIPEVDMKQIPQSQFISICETLYQIITSLNENQIRATLECIISRLCCSFNSVVIPPLSAVRKSLDFLVKEQKLDIVDGSYYAKNTRNSRIHSGAEPPWSKSYIRRRENTISSESKPSPKRTSTTKLVKRKDDTFVRPHEETLEGKGRMERKSKATTDIAKEKDIQEAVFKNTDNYKQTNKGNRERRTKQPRSSFFVSKHHKKRVSQGSYSFNKLIDHDIGGPVETSEFNICKKQTEKRLSLLGKLSRLFKTRIPEEDSINEGYESGSEHQLSLNDNDGQNDVHGERAKLVRKNRNETEQDRDGNIKKKEKFSENTKGKKKRTTSRFQKNNEKDKEDLRRQSGSNRISYNSIHNTRKNREKFHKPRNTKPKISSGLHQPTFLCSSSVYNKNDWELENQNIATEAWKTSTDHDQFNDPICWSATDNSSNDQNSEYSFSSSSSSDVKNPFQFSSPPMNKQTPKQNFCGVEVLNFCSTQAICGDLQKSTISLDPTDDRKQRSSLLDINETMVNTKSQNMPLIYQKRQSGEHKESPNKNLQLIGVL